MPSGYPARSQATTEVRNPFTVSPLPPLDVPVSLKTDEILTLRGLGSEDVQTGVCANELAGDVQHADDDRCQRQRVQTRS